MSLISPTVLWEKPVGKAQSDIDTVSKRARLKPRKNPYWQGVSGGRGGVSLGYRKGAKGAGVWIAKIVLDGSRIEEKLGIADDDGAPIAALNYKAAVAATLGWSRQQHAALEARREAGAAGPTVRSAIETYVKARSKRSKREGDNASGRLTKHVLSDQEFAGTPLSKLRATTIEAWRSRLNMVGLNRVVEENKPRPISRATVNRLLNDLRAALNACAEAHRRELPPHLLAEIRVGTRAESVPDEARKQLLTDLQIRSAIDAAFEVNEDFGRLVLLAAATGARYSQLAAVRVGDVQTAVKRVMMPGSKKGRAARTRPPVPIPLADEVMVKLGPAIHDRHPDEPLLMRWAYRNVGPFKWEKERRRPWIYAYEVDKYWSATIERAELPAGTIMYALRHSSIVRGLRAGLPVRLVASLHDTSTEMIEKHYSAFIVDMTEELARRAALAF